MTVTGILGRILHKTVEVASKPFCTAVVAAAGYSSRMGSDKLFMELGGLPVIALTLKQLQQSDYIHEIVVVTREESIVAIADLCAEHEIDKATKIVCGGEDRLDSVIIGSTEASEKAEFLAVHDGARPLVTGDVIERVIKAAYKHNAAAPAVPVNDTIKIANNRIVTGTPERSTLFAIQTPQVFRAELLKAALQNAKEKGLTVTDDCSAVEATGAYIYLSDGSFENIKITTATDLILAEAILEARKDENRSRL